MKTKKQQIWKHISLLVFAFATSLFLFTNCSNNDDVYSKPQVAISENGAVLDKNVISFDEESSSRTIEIKSNRDWEITKETDAEWIDITPTSGLEGTSTITSAVKSNVGAARKESIIIGASTARITISVNQASVDGVEFKDNTIEEVRTMYANSGETEWTITEPLQLTAIITSDREGGNSTSLKNGFLQDEEGGAIAFRVNESTHPFNMGDEVNIDLKGAIISEYAGALQIAFSTAKAIVQNTDVNVTPQEVTIEEILAGGFDATLVKIKDVQFKDYKDLTYFFGEENGTNRTLENKYGKTVIARTARYAKFKDKVIPKGKGDIVGIMSVFNGTWQLTIRNLDDVSEMSNDESTRFITETPPVTPGDNDGTKENPYTVAEAIAKQGSGTGVWVKAFIVGTSNSGGDFVPIFSAENASGTNVIIADSKNETNVSKLVAVQLAWDGDARGALNLVSNPGMYKAEVLLKGDLVKYFGVAGLKEVKEYEVVKP